MSVKDRGESLALLTRPAERNQPLAEYLATQQIASLCLPALELKPMQFDLHTHLPLHYDWLVFVSSMAVKSFFQAYKQTKPNPMVWPATVKAAAVGAATAQAIQQAAPWLPKQSIVAPSAEDPNQDSEALWRLMQPQTQPYQRVLLVRGQHGRDWLGEQLSEAGFIVSRIAVYQRHATQWTSQQLQPVKKAFDTKQSCVCLLSSSESVVAILDNLQRLGFAQHIADLHFVAIHPRIVQCLHQELQQRQLAPARSVVLSSPSIESIRKALLQATLNS